MPSMDMEQRKSVFGLPINAFFKTHKGGRHFSIRAELVTFDRIEEE